MPITMALSAMVVSTSLSAMASPVMPDSAAAAASESLFVAIVRVNGVPFPIDASFVVPD